MLKKVMEVSKKVVTLLLVWMAIGAVVCRTIASIKSLYEDFEKLTK